MRYLPRVVLVALLSAASLSAGRSESRLAEAIQAGDREEVRKLLKDPAEVKATEADGTTPLHWAVRSDDLETSKALLGAGANASAANRYGVTPLSLAAVNGNVAMIETLLSARADGKRCRRARAHRPRRRRQSQRVAAWRDRPDVGGVRKPR
jgi:ankyrin repeat protein